MVGTQAYQKQVQPQANLNLVDKVQMYFSKEHVKAAQPYVEGFYSTLKNWVSGESHDPNELLRELRAVPVQYRNDVVTAWSTAAKDIGIDLEKFLSGEKPSLNRKVQDTVLHSPFSPRIISDAFWALSGYNTAMMASAGNAEYGVLGAAAGVGLNELIVRPGSKLVAKVIYSKCDTPQAKQTANMMMDATGSVAIGVTAGPAVGGAYLLASLFEYLGSRAQEKGNMSKAYNLNTWGRAIKTFFALETGVNSALSQPNYQVVDASDALKNVEMRAVMTAVPLATGLGIAGAYALSKNENAMQVVRVGGRVLLVVGGVIIGAVAVSGCSPVSADVRPALEMAPAVPTLTPTMKYDPSLSQVTDPESKPSQEPVPSLQSKPSQEPSPSKEPSEQPSQQPSASNTPTVTPTITPTATGTPVPSSVLDYLFTTTGQIENIMIAYKLSELLRYDFGARTVTWYNNGQQIGVCAGSDHNLADHTVQITDPNGKTLDLGKFDLHVNRTIDPKGEFDCATATGTGSIDAIFDDKDLYTLRINDPDGKTVETSTFRFIKWEKPTDVPKIEEDKPDSGGGGGDNNSTNSDWSDWSEV